ncbi:CDP-alcohol phosphatidyltransferase family protein [Candidatus Saccharibacteria bacterium]|nr:CDP-alcohol phosphatidyltransferase family protein [Candidatus Saccharibacteria bacterium]
MKYYVADLLTLIRFILTVILFVMCFAGGSLAAAFCIFILGELTDAFDGTAATKWPFPKNKTPKYRKYAAKYDMWTDTLLAVAMILFFILRVNLVAGLVIGVGYSLLATIVDLIVYGKLFGHPDDAHQRSLLRRNFPLAKKIILARRNLYLALMFAVAAWTLYASEWPLGVKIAITIIACAVSLFLWFFLSQRRHNISRDAVDIERRLSK